MLVKTAQPKVKVKWKTLAKFVRASLAMGGPPPPSAAPGGGSAAGGDQVPAPSKAADRVVCCCGMGVVTGEDEEEPGSEEVRGTAKVQLSQDVSLPPGDPSEARSDVTPHRTSLNPMNHQQAEVELTGNPPEPDQPSFRASV